MYREVKNMEQLPVFYEFLRVTAASEK